MSVPARISQWWLYLRDAGRTFDVDPYTLGAVCDRESLGGEAHGLDVPGPGGCGDRAPRKGRKYAVGARFKAILLSDKTLAYLPADGRGWGRGLMQLDYEYHPGLMERTLDDGSPAWADPAANIRAGADILTAGYLAFGGDELPAIASYNAGIGAARRVMLELVQPVSSADKQRALDAITESGNYVSDVLSRRARFLLEDPTP